MMDFEFRLAICNVLSSGASTPYKRWSKCSRGDYRNVRVNEGAEGREGKRKGGEVEGRRGGRGTCFKVWGDKTPLCARVASRNR